MLPFEKQLAARLDQLAGETRRRNLIRVESVPPPIRFFGQHREISRDGFYRFRLRLESGKLRVARVPARFAAQNFLRQQSFPPRRHQSFRIEMTRMNRPEPH
jgi:plasmid stabilization system protein ParE